MGVPPPLSPGRTRPGPVRPSTARPGSAGPAGRAGANLKNLRSSDQKSENLMGILFLDRVRASPSIHYKVDFLNFYPRKMHFPIFRPPPIPPLPGLGQASPPLTASPPAPITGRWLISYMCGINVPS